MSTNNFGPTQGPNNLNSNNLNNNNANQSDSKKSETYYPRICPNSDNTALEKYKDGKRVAIMPYLRVVSIVKKLAEDELPEEIKIEYKTKGGISGCFQMPLEEMYDSNIILKYLMKNHVIINPSNRYDIQEYLLNQVALAVDTSTYDYEHKICGWYELEGKKLFFWDDTDIGNGRVSKCIKKLGNFKNGQESEYDEMLERFVYNNKAMSLAYTLGFTGVLVSRVSQYKDLGVLLVGLSGQSTTGKTTAMKLQASIFADADDVKGRMIKRNEGSDIGFQAQLKEMHGPCILFDDIDQNKKNAEKIGQLIHSLSKGTSRVVSNTSGDALFNRGSFSGIVIFTSERSLLDRTDKEMGMMVRFLDLNDIQWTVDGPSAEAIKDCICKNYGFKGVKFGKFLEGYTDEALVELFDSVNKDVQSKIGNKDQFFHRISKSLAAIVTTAKLLNKCFDIELDIDGMLEEIISIYEKGAEERNRPLAAYKFILEYFKKHYTKFNILPGDFKDYSIMSKDKEPMGFARIKTGEVIIGMSVNDCDKILTANGFTQLPNYAKYWKANGLTRTAKGRTTCSATTSLYARHYEFVYPKAIEEINTFMSPFFEKARTEEQQAELDELGLGAELEETQDELGFDAEPEKQTEQISNCNNVEETEAFDDSAAIAEIFKEEE